MKLGYFDNAATTYRKPDGMYQYISDFMQECGANADRGNNTFSMTAGAMVYETRKAMLSLVKAPETKEVVFCPSATIALNTVLFGIEFKEGDNVYVSHFEHNAVMRTLYQIQSRIGIKIEYLPMDKADYLKFDLAATEDVFSKRQPRVVVISHVSNVIGLVAPINELSSIAKRHGAKVIVDAAQACGVVDVDLHCVDYYIFEGHKTLLAPMGIGGFICDKHDGLKPMIFGGTGVDSANRFMPLDIPKRFEAGTLNLMAIAGLKYSVNWLLSHADIAKDNIKQNFNRLFNLLNQYHFLKIVSTSAASEIVSCKVSGYTSDEFGKILSEHGIAVRSGLHCAPEAHRYLGTFPDGLVRFSISCLTTQDDIDYLKKILEKIGEEL